MTRSKFHFSPARAGRLMGHQLVEDAKLIGWALAVVLAINAIGIVGFKMVPLNSAPNGAFWVLLYVIGSSLLASTALRSMHGRSATEWILFPASVGEKFTAVLVRSVVIVPLALALLTFLVAVLSDGALHLATGQHGWVAKLQRAATQPWSWDLAPAEGSYEFFPVVIVRLSLFFTPLFFVGSTMFRKRSWFKSFFLVGLFLLASPRLWSLFAALCYWLVFQDQILLVPHPDSGFFGDLTRLQEACRSTTLDWVENLWSCTTLVLCLAYGWAKVREKEAKDEVQH